MVVYSDSPDDSLWRSRFNGEARIPLTIAPLHGRYARWSPDGKLILFTGARQNQPRNIYFHFPRRRISSSGASRRMGRLGGGLVARWLSHRRVHAKPKSPIRLWTLYAGAHDRNAKGVAGGRKSLTEPRWSPDGRYIAAIDKPGARLLVYDMQKSRWTLLASGGLLESLHWSRDSSDDLFSGPNR